MNSVSLKPQLTTLRAALLTLLEHCVKERTAVPGQFPARRPGVSAVASGPRSRGPQSRGAAERPAPGEGEGAGAGPSGGGALGRRRSRGQT